MNTVKIKAIIDAYNYAKNQQKLNIDQPVTYIDKIGWLKVFDATDLKTQCADKIAVHEFSKQILGKDICVPILKIFNSPEEINFTNLPKQFALKCNHGSGYNHIVKDKSTENLEEIKVKFSKWTKENFALRGGELHYYDIKPTVYAEQFLSFTEEYQFLCFNGIPKFCQVISNRFDKKLCSNNFYDMNFNFVDICNLNFPNNPQHRDSKPQKFEDLKQLAKTLSAPFKFVRVDLYLINDSQIYLSEMTFTPGNARIKFRNPDHQLILGKMIQL